MLSLGDGGCLEVPGGIRGNGGMGSVGEIGRLLEEKGRASVDIVNIPCSIDGSPL